MQDTYKAGYVGVIMWFGSRFVWVHRVTKLVQFLTDHSETTTTGIYVHNIISHLPLFIACRVTTLGHILALLLYDGVLVISSNSCGYFRITLQNFVHFIQNENSVHFIQKSLKDREFCTFYTKFFKRYCIFLPFPYLEEKDWVIMVS